jgi:hypothetical protein
VAGEPVVFEAEVAMEEGYIPDATAFIEITREHGGEGYMLGLQYLPEGPQMKLWKHTAAGGWDCWYTVPWAWEMNRAVRLRLEARGAHVEGYADGELVGQKDDPEPIEVGSVGLGAYFCRARFTRLQGTAAGRPVPPPAWRKGRLVEPWRGSPEGGQIASFARQGVHLFSFPVNAGQWWLGEGRYDFGPVENLMRGMLQADPEGMALLRVDLNPPGWWLETHPAERMALRSLDGGQWTLPWASFSSRAWQQAAGEALTAMIRHFAAAPMNEHILGWHPAAGDCGEWSYAWGEGVGDYSPAQTAAYRDWLRGRYGDDTGLRQAWRQADATLAAVEVPAPARRYHGALGNLYDPRQEADCIDYRRFHNEADAEAICHLARVAKQACAGRQLVGVFYGYHLSAGWRPGEWHDSGHLALMRVLAAPDVDFVSAPYNYRNRGPGGGCVPQNVASSIALAGKLYLAEDDTRTFLTPDDPGHGFGRCPDLVTTVAVLERNWAAAALQGGGLWWMDQGGGWYDDSDLVEALGRLVRHHVELPREAFASAAEIAVLLDEPSTAYLPQNYELMLPLVIEQLADELPFVGAPFDVLLTTDLPRARPYKLYMVPCAPAPTEETRANLRGLYRRGATILWLHAPGLMTAEGPSVEAAGELVGMRLALRMIGGPTRVRLTVSGGLARGLPPGFAYGTDRRLGPLLEVVDPQAERLGEARCMSLETLDGTAWPWFCYQGTGLATKAVDQGRAIFSATGPVPAPLLRNIARAAGVKMYDRKGNIAFASEGLAAIHDAADGRWTRISRR